MKKLLALGDSFTYGQELVNQTDAYPYLVGAHYGYEVTNLALPGSGNTRVVRELFTHGIEYDAVIIGWSHFARVEFADELGVYDIWPGCANNRVAFDGKVQHRRDLIHYITAYHNDLYALRQHLVNVIATQSYCKVNKISLVMVDAFGNNIFYRKYKDKIVDLTNQVDIVTYAGWPNQTLNEWAKETERGPHGHFLERGHRVVADNIIKFSDGLL